MFENKRIDVKVGDVFVERIRQPGRLSRLFRFRPKVSLPPTGNSWIVTGLMQMDGLPHAQLQSEQTDGDGVASATRLIAITALEMEETYLHISPA